ncbi:MAG: hypothetical protein IPG47_16540 [Thermoflexaceae bacterium]|nr:hypothetical protein [Thermoflexaceae bacterium]
MEHLAEILKLVEAGIQRDPAKVSRYARLLCSKLEADGDMSSADLLRRAATPATAAGLRAAKLIPKDLTPVDSESRISVADISRPDPQSVQLVLDPEPREIIGEFLETFRSRSELLSAASHLLATCCYTGLLVAVRAGPRSLLPLHWNSRL